MIIGITGHRPDKIGGHDPLDPAVARVRKGLRDALAADWPVHAISGMALGVDTWFAETCVELGIPFVAALPCDGMDATWPLGARERHQVLLAKAKEIVVVSPGLYKPWKMQRRNEYIVDHCTRLLAVFDGSPGGTWNCLAYAAEVGREVKHVDWRDDSVAPARSLVR